MCFYNGVGFYFNLKTVQLLMYKYFVGIRNGVHKTRIIEKSKKKMLLNFSAYLQSTVLRLPDNECRLYLLKQYILLCICTVDCIPDDEWR